MTSKARNKTSGASPKRDSARDSNPKQPSGSDGSKLDTLVRLLREPTGATLAELAAATGWQAHSVRGALSGSLKKKGHSILSEKTDGERRYRIGAA